MKIERRLPGQAGVMTALILACVFVSVRAEGLEFPMSPGAKEWWKTVTPETIADYVAKGADVNARNKLGNTPLHVAAGHNPNPEVIDVLVRLGADVNARHEFGWTPLHWAARRNEHPAVIDALLDAGANAKLRDNALPADYAARNKHIKDSKARWRLHEAR